MHMNIYMFFTKYEYFMYFLVSWFFTRVFTSSGPVHILGFTDSMTGLVHILGFTDSMTGPVSDNIGLYMEYEANNLSLYFVDAKTQQLRTLAVVECEVEYMFTDKIDVNLLPTNQY